ncbi:uncharacterized protein SCHCODRAFT_02522016 [Schizophyllum commune H4-8]|nr:uncharacterized protein SCHCODRAFT_02522016 [Schizophyllum commune H4-8]KAI5884831.1 hypothetical protein SCHCODRAFT_02522016 [Schizophyllum commune H4-8]
MHPALDVYDIQRLIALDGSLQSSDLYHLALVSRSWQDVADPILWEELPSITPLLKLMPKDVWTYETRFKFWVTFDVIVSARKIRLEDWDPISRKLRNLRTLRVHPDCEREDWASIDLAILECPPPAGFLALLRNLSVSCTCCDGHGIDCWLEYKMRPNFLAILFAQPQLRAIRIENIYDRLVPRLPSMILACDNPVSLDIDGGYLGEANRIYNEFLIEAMLSVDSRLADLSLHINISHPASADVLAQISRLRSLTDLDISLTYSTMDNLALAARCFPSLRRLKIKDGPPRLIVQILRAVPTRQMEYLDCHIYYISAREIEELCETMHDHCDHDTLRSFKLIGWLEDDVAEMRVIQALAAFTRLEHLRVLEERVDITEFMSAAANPDDEYWSRELKER